MKKIISILLVLITLMSFPVFTYAEESVVKNGDIIQFGNYPQTQVRDKNLIRKLDKVSKTWISYNYFYEHEYKGANGYYSNGQRSDNMQYADFCYDGVSYRAVNFTNPSYMSSSQHMPSDSYRIDSDANEVYYFKYEPISWVVADKENGIVISQKSLDQQGFNEEYYHDDSSESRSGYYQDEAMTIYANDYEYSQLRKWLNDDFMTTAFTSQQANVISQNEYFLDEYFYSIGSYSDLKRSVTDKITIPSSREIKAYATAPVMLTDYARVQGHYETDLTTRTLNNLIWDDGRDLDAVGNDLEGPFGQFVEKVSNIVPMMKLSVLADNTEMQPFSASGKKCNCVCHKFHSSGLHAFIYKFVRWFWRLFKTKQYCNCGLKHY